MDSSTRTKRRQYKSGLESRAATLIPNPEKYETVKLNYTVNHTYIPDFPLTDNSFIEVKGYFKASDRAKHLAIREQHPELVIYFLFANSKNKLNRNSKTTYGDWCLKHGFEYADIKNGIPSHWLKKKRGRNASS